MIFLVFLPITVRSHLFSLFFWTKCCSSSYSGTSCRVGTSESADSRPGMLITFLFEPFCQCLTGYAKRAGNASHTGPLKAGFQYLRFPLFTIAGNCIKSTVLVTAFTMVFLFSILYIMTITNQLFTPTVRTRFNNHDHTSGSAFSLIYPTHPPVPTLPLPNTLW